jgi:hypothetical protein
MFLRKVRRIGRVFAIALLAWTAVDLLDRSACQNHGVLPAAAAPAAAGWFAEGGAPAHGHGEPGALAGHAGDCFCCSPFVDVRTPFHLSVASTGVWFEPQGSPVFASVTQAHLYRPPIAA